MNREDVIDNMVEQYRAQLEEKKDVELLGGMPEPRIEVVVELLKEMVEREYGSKLAVNFVEGGDFESYRKAIAKIEALPIHQRRATVVWVCLEDVELLRYPLLDVEFSRKEGTLKLGVTGHPDKVAEILRLIGERP